ncbi:Pectinesterase A precursor [Pseudobythopirellula maris]|uniref:Pectinesterase A n=1 Tax=Pseudobythopirellula maris TaxID=2527991 RepID=A0A5C5ZLA7_9BACT|nr:pectinesterase family protein [Pseudobythopirellula maris]TWT88179.1 Pectinesterase A precursor [Pseudobythopirellula maris]
MPVTPKPIAAVLLAWTVVLAASPSLAQEGRQAHVVLVGDSTVADAAGWGWAFAACVTDGVRVTNLARGGRSSSSFYDEGRWAEALALEPDWVLIQFGHNDEPGHPNRENAPDEGYCANLERCVDEARAVGVKPVLVTPLARRQWGRESHNSDRIVSSLEPYAAVVRAIGEEKGAPVIDLHFRSIEVYQSLGRDGCKMISPIKESGALDGSHLNRAGGAMFGSMVAMDCRSYVPVLDRLFSTGKLAELQKSNPPPVAGGRDDRLPAAGDPIAKGERTIVVARDGGGEFRTPQEAIDAAPSDNSDRTTIRLGPGVYTGQVVVPPHKINLTLVGESRADSIVSYALTTHDPRPAGVLRSYAGCGLVVLADGFRCENLTVRQVAGDHGQAIALRIDGDRAVVRNCDLLGWQDTVRLERGRHYLSDCRIEGRVDYVYGGATAWLEGCTLHTKGEGFITAASTPRGQAWGYVFHRCVLTGTKPESVYLGRPWRPWASVTFLDCEMAESVRPVGWDNWRSPDNERTVRYAEHGNRGPGAADDRRAAWARRLSDEEAARITPEIVLGDWINDGLAE